MGRWTAMPAEFDLGAVEQGLAGTAFSGQVKHLLSVGSTNQVALEAALGGARAGVWVAEEQTAGRGRGGHGWHSAAGEGLYLSALVTPRIPLSEAPKIPLATGLAVGAAIAETTGIPVDIRWPNDLMCGRRKLGGILVESVSETAPGGVPGLRYAVIGIGVNVCHREFPEELREMATSLFIESGCEFAREPLLAAILGALDRELGALGKDAAGLLDRFAAASSWVAGKHVRVDEEGGYTGWTCGLDQRGFLRVKDAAGSVRTVLSGGVRPF